MIADMLPSELPNEEGGISGDKIINDLTEARELYDNVLDSSDLSQICSSEALKNIKRKLGREQRETDYKKFSSLAAIPRYGGCVENVFKS